MNPKTFFTRLQTLLKGMVWEGTSNKMFGDNVFIVPVFPGQMIFQIVSPTCYILEGSGTYHLEHPQILFQDFSLIFFIESTMSQFGETTLIGGARTANTSRGAGTLDIEAEIVKNIIKTVALTEKISIIEKGTAKCQYAQSNAPLIYRIINFSTLLETY